jgi:hypothetical protein
MAFLFQDQNQGTRNETATRESAAAATVLFHPDYNRRLRIHTESADPSFPAFAKRKALAGLGCFTLTAGGDFHPALRTSAARNGRPEVNMAKGRRPGKDLWHRESTCRHAEAGGGGDQMARFRCELARMRSCSARPPPNAKVNDWFTPDSDSGLFSN